MTAELSFNHFSSTVFTYTSTYYKPWTVLTRTFNTPSAFDTVCCRYDWQTLRSQTGGRCDTFNQENL